MNIILVTIDNGLLGFDHLFFGSSSMGNCCGTGNGKVEGSLPAPEAIYEVKTIPNRNDHSSATSITKVSVPRTLKSEQDILSCPNLNSFTLSELKNATRNFCPERLIGEGGFGYVFKGWIDEQTIGTTTDGCGMAVAVKKLKPEGFQGHKEWMCEVNFLGQLHHPNLVRLIGYCIEDDYRLLVYEFMPKGSLEKHLFKRRCQPLSWTTRIKVAMGAARGLSFLHECNQQVIYRDFKASNVLLDSEFNAKLSDFGLARAGPTGNKTHVSTQIVGTYGYAAPEYIATGRLTTRCDVYSFGVVLLELLTGRRVFDKTKVGLEQNLIDWAKPYLGEKRKIYRIMDVKMEGQYPQRAAFLVGRLALQCINEAKHRPSMSEVVAVLEDDIIQRTAYNHSELHRNRAFFSGQNTPCRSVSKSPLTYSDNSPIYMTAKGSPLQPHRRTPSI